MLIIHTTRYYWTNPSVTAMSRTNLESLFFFVFVVIHIDFHSSSHFFSSSSSPAVWLTIQTPLFQEHKEKDDVVRSLVPQLTFSPAAAMSGNKVRDGTC